MQEQVKDDKEYEPMEAEDKHNDGMNAVADRIESILSCPIQSVRQNSFVAIEIEGCLIYL